MAEDEEEHGGLVGYVIDTLRKPIDIVFSTTAQRAYLTTILLFSAATVLLGLATTAYTLFYWSYIPRIGFERTIHLQFDNVYPTADSRYDSSGNPHGIVQIASQLVSSQRYDVFVELVLPRTVENRDAGNFMLEAVMYAAGSMVDPLKDTLVPGAAEANNQLAKSRRAAILPYRSYIVEQLWKLTEVHWYLLGWRKEADTLKISMFEGVEFARGWRNVPSSMSVRIQSSTRMQIYSAKALFRARLRGLRWLMYNHRIISAVFLVGAFWFVEMVFTVLAWAVLSGYLNAVEEEGVKVEGVQGEVVKIKTEDEDGERTDLSDTERTFPTSSKQQTLRYESPAIKQEDDEDEGAVVLPEASTRATEADDEDDDEDQDVFIDSGIGTSLESSAGRRDSVRKRRGRTGSGDGGK